MTTSNETQAVEKRRRVAQWLIQVLLWGAVVVLLWWVWRSVPVDGVLTLLGKLRWWQVAGLALVNSFVLLMFGGRWWVVLRTLGQQLPFGAVALHRLAGFGVSYFTPGPQVGGEPMQARLLQVQHGLALPPILASIGLDRMVEFLVNLSVMAVGLILTLSLQTGAGVTGFSLGLVVVVIALLVGFVGLLMRGVLPGTWVLDRLPGGLRSNAAVQTVRAVVAETEAQAVAVFRHRRGGLVAALGFSLLSWVGIFVEYWLIVAALGVRLSPGQLVSALATWQVSFLLPLPGGLGALEAGQVFIFTQLGLDPAIGLGVSVYMRLRDVTFGGVGLVWGAWGWNRRK